MASQVAYWSTRQQLILKQILKLNLTLTLLNIDSVQTPKITPLRTIMFAKNFHQTFRRVYYSVTSLTTCWFVGKLPGYHCKGSVNLQNVQNGVANSMPLLTRLSKWFANKPTCGQL